jgi:hypothetical protein
MSRETKTRIAGMSILTFGILIGCSVLAGIAMVSIPN